MMVASFAEGRGPPSPKMKVAKNYLKVKCALFVAAFIGYLLSLVCSSYTSSYVKQTKKMS